MPKLILPDDCIPSPSQTCEKTPVLLSRIDTTAFAAPIIHQTFRKVVVDETVDHDRCPFIVDDLQSASRAVYRREVRTGLGVLVSVADEEHPEGKCCSRTLETCSGGAFDCSRQGGVSFRHLGLVAIEVEDPGVLGQFQEAVEGDVIEFDAGKGLSLW